MRNVLLSELMVKPVVTAHEDDALSLVETKMRQHHIRHIPVVNGANQVVGMITWTDLLGCVRPNRTEDGLLFDREQMDQFILKHVMAKEVQVLQPTDTLAHAVAMMAREKYGCIPIVAENRVIQGVVTQIDVLNWLYRCLERGMFG